MLEVTSKEFNITKTNKMAYRPATNGLVERKYRNLLKHFRTLVGDVSTSCHERMDASGYALSELFLANKTLAIRLI